MTIAKLAQRLRGLKNRRHWSWERLCREMHRVMDSEGPSHTTLFRYATGRVKKPNVLVVRWVEEAREKLEEEHV